jgi:gliding motility-associated lipoprotein GldH
MGLFMSIASCDRKKVFESYKELDEKGWNKDSIVVFNVPLADTIKNHNLYVNIRNKGTYAYSNIYLFM